MTTLKPYIPTQAILSKNDGDGFIVMDAVPADGVAVVTLGGELTYKPSLANTYARTIVTLLRENGITDVPVFSIAYEFGNTSPELERINIFRRAGRKIRMARNDKVNETKEQRLARMIQDEPIPQYIIQAYNQIFVPRIIPNTPANILAARMRGLVLYGHSHGAAAIRQLGEYMRTQLQAMGYTAPEIKNIQNSVLVVQHAPTTPLEHPRFTTISFVSAEDTAAKMHNYLSEFIYDNSADIVPMFLDTLGGNVFVAGRLKNTISGEHDPKGLLNHAVTNADLTEDGKIIFAAERNVIVNGVRSAMTGEPMPTIAELTSGNGIDFEQMRNNGEITYNWAVARIAKQNLKRAHQK